ncbi:MAG: L,D-transpeptidase [Hyphomicrobiaceae bacterium]
MYKPTVAALAALSLAFGILGATAGSAHARKIRKNSTADRVVVSFDKAHKPGQIIVSFSDRRLYHITKRGRAVSYPIAVPRPQSRWQGANRITQKKKNPTWTPTKEMRIENPNLPTMVQGGDPKNPLGKRALYLGSTLYRIHGTDAPWTIGKNVSKGCVRMHNNHVAELFNKVSVGTKVTATYRKFRTAALSPVTYVQGSSKYTKKRRVVRRVIRNGKVVRIVRKKKEPKLLDWLLGS